MCLLDKRSGAAQQVHSVLRILVKAGWHAHAVHMTLTDGQSQYPISTIIDKRYADPSNHGKVIEFERQGIQHHLFYTQNSNGQKLTQQEAQKFIQVSQRTLQKIKPDVLITYGKSSLFKALMQVARTYCTNMVFFLANTTYESPDIFQSFDQVLVNSRFSQNHYKKKIGIQSRVLPEALPPNVVIDPESVMAVNDPPNRRFGFITMINPCPQKGGTLFARLLDMAKRERPDWTFLAVEGRMTKEQWAQSGLDLAHQPNVFWIPNQRDMRRVYARTSIVLFPSFWEEAAGRVGIESSLGGIPVLASSHGGMPEMLNGAGFLFDIPQRCRENYGIIPSEQEVRPWLDTIALLMDDEYAYQEASQRAIQCSVWQHPEQVKSQVLKIFDDIYNGLIKVQPARM
jgi:glycosyltransferase involved in cell wall biosynthesis